MFCSTGVCTCLSNYVAIQGYCYLSESKSFAKINKSNLSILREEPRGKWVSIRRAVQCSVAGE